MPDRSPNEPRPHALGDELVRIHDALRADLAALLADVEAAAHAGAAPSAPIAPVVRTQLFERCRSICGTVHAHHTNESERGFPLLEKRFPGLAPVLDRLREEHEKLAGLRRRFEETLDRLGVESVDTVHTGLRRLAAELEAHFDREERQLISALNSL